MPYQTFAAYKRWLEEEYPKLKLEAGAVEKGPTYDGKVVNGPAYYPTTAQEPAPWKFEWFTLYPDHFYFRVFEVYYRYPKKKGGMGYRAGFSFHYGPTPALTDWRGLPSYDSSEPFVIRIDLDERFGPHMHYNGEDHIPQSRVDGLVIADVDMFRFVNAVGEYRATKKPFDEILAFKVTA